MSIRKAITILFLIINFLNAEKIKNITYEKLTYMSSSLANDISSLKIGDELDLALVNKSILEFYKQGYFDDIYATFKNGELKFIFKERPLIANIEIKGYGSENEKNALIGQIGIKKGETFNELKLLNAENIIRQAISYRGYYDTVIETDTKILNENSVSIIFNVNRGSEITIESSHYEGAKHLNKRTIESLSANKERDFLGWMWGFNDGKLILNELELDKLRIQDVYLRRGFLDVNVSNSLLKVDLNSYKATLLYNIQEGDSYKIKDIKFVLSEKDKIKEKELFDILKSTIGKTINSQEIREDINAIRLKIADLGYAFVNVEPEMKKEENKEVVIIFHVNFNKKVYINDVVITGNKRSEDRIIRREILVAPGDVYSLSDIKLTENNLNRTGFFNKVIIDEKKIGDDLIDLVINVDEGRTGEISFSLGYGSFYGFMLNGSLNERNLFGSGIGIGIQADINFGGSVNKNSNRKSITKQVVNLSITNPRVLDSKWSTSFNVFYNQYLTYSYTEYSYGFGVSLGRLLANNLRFSLDYDISRTNTFDFVDDMGNPQPLYARYFSSKNDETGGEKGLWSRSYSGHYAPYKSSITPNLNFDTTDGYYFPRSGNISNLSLQISGIWGDVRYLKFYGRSSFYADLEKILNLDFIARYKMQAGYLFRFSKNDYLPLNDTFYMGGIGSVRGYSSSSITPVDSLSLRIGGDGIFVNSAELSFGLLEAAKIRLTLFADVGILTYKGSKNIGSLMEYGTTSSTTYALPKGGAGFQIEWVSPIGPLVLVFPFAWFDGKKIFTYGYASKIQTMTDNASEYPSFFEFTVGTRF